MQTQSGLSTHLKSQSELLSREQAASYLGVTSRTLAVWKSTGRYNLPVIKIGRLVKYRISDLDNFIARRTVGGDRND